MLIFASNVDTVTLIKRRITQNYTALTVQEGEPISLLSDSNIVNAVRAESPDSEIQWSHNGIFLLEEERRLEIKDYEISMRHNIFDTLLIRGLFFLRL